MIEAPLALAFAAQVTDSGAGYVQYLAGTLTGSQSQSSPRRSARVLPALDTLCDHSAPRSTLRHDVITRFRIASKQLESPPKGVAENEFERGGTCFRPKGM